MALTKTSMERRFKSGRSLFVGSNVSVRISGSTHTGTASSIEYSDQVGSMASLQGASGAVRLVVSDLRKPYPEPGDLIDVKEQSTGEWNTRRVMLPRYDQTGATVRIDYEESDT